MAIVWAASFPGFQPSKVLVISSCFNRKHQHSIGQYSRGDFKVALNRRETTTVCCVALLSSVVLTQATYYNGKTAEKIKHVISANFQFLEIYVNSTYKAKENIGRFEKCNCTTYKVNLSRSKIPTSFREGKAQKHHIFK